MARVRKIERNPKDGKNYFLVDANFLAMKYIPSKIAPNSKEKNRIDKCMEWWNEINSQLKNGKARVYVPDICIAETFKVIAKKYYEDKWYKTSSAMNNARQRFRRDIVNKPETLRSANRIIKFHDLPTSRDVIISVDRFYRLFMKHEKKVQLPDLIIVASAKYLIDFFDIQKNRLHIVTLDKALWEGTKKINELPNAYDPVQPLDYKDRIFI